MYNTLFLSGKVTGDPNYREKFKKEKIRFESLGFVVLTPCVLPSNGFSYSQYMVMTETMISCCKYIHFLKDFRESKGALVEFRRCFQYIDGVPKIVDNLGKVISYKHDFFDYGGGSYPYRKYIQPIDKYLWRN